MIGGSTQCGRPAEPFRFRSRFMWVIPLLSLPRSTTITNGSRNLIIIPTGRFTAKTSHLFPRFSKLATRTIARHPKTQFVVLHVGNYAEDLANVSGMLNRYPNSPRRKSPHASENWDASREPHGSFSIVIRTAFFSVPTQFREVKRRRSRFRRPSCTTSTIASSKLDDEYFDYAPAPVPPQGRWRIYALGLPDGILKKVYHDNAARLLRISK